MLPRSLIRQLKWTRRADLSTPKTMSGVASSSRPLPVLTLYTKEDCSLCDEAVEALKPLSQRVSSKASPWFGPLALSELAVR